MPKQNRSSTKTYFEEKFAQMNSRFDKLDKKLDWFTGKYTKLDGEQTLLANKVSEHTDDLETIKQKLGIATS